MGSLKDSLKPVDRVEIVTLVDNYADALLDSTDIVKRAPHTEGDVIQGDTLIAEHGLCMLVTVYQEGEKHSILFDGGYTKVGVLHNLDILKLGLEDVETIVVSHRHMDHTAGIYSLIDKIGRPIMMVVHPEVFLHDRYISLKDGKTIRFPKVITKEMLLSYGVETVESVTPTLIAGDFIAVTGEIERTTPFEKGMPNALVKKNGKMERDPVSDDQGLLINVKDRGLVVISGCSHAGIINTVLYARKLSGIERLHAVLGGFHLTGPLYEPIIEDTINALKELSPQVIVPMHCTGWTAVKRFSEAFPESFILNAVGSTFTFGE